MRHRDVGSYGKLTFHKVRNQMESLGLLRDLAYRAAFTPEVREAAINIVADCTARDEVCELQALYNAVKHGDARVNGLGKGVKYMADPQGADYFTAPDRLLKNCKAGACAEDCDGSACLLASMGHSLGFTMGLRVYRPAHADQFEHVYAVAAIPKIGPREAALGMDTTVDYADLGWEPPIDDPSQVKTAWLIKG